MKVFVGLVTLVATAAAVESFYGPYFPMPSPYRYNCVEEKCVRVEVYSKNKVRTPSSKEYTTLSECNLVCGQYGSLWPQPSQLSDMAEETSRFVPENVRFTKVSTSDPEVEEMLMEQAHYFQRNLHFMHPDYPQRSKGPFSEYQEERYQNYGSQRNNPKSHGSFKSELDDSDFYEEGSSYNVHEYDLFDRNYQQGSIFYSDERNSERRLKRFDSQYRRERDQMRYERISPFNKQPVERMAERQFFNVEITVTGQETQLRLDTDESYELAVQTVGDTTTVTIIAGEYYGARHALETLSQLIAYDELSNSLQVVRTAKISDEPSFKYRGLLLDTGRNFYPQEEILSLLDTMATNKLNTFHWRIADAASFPLYSQRQPEMTYYGAYSPRKVYYPKDVREIVEYANQRGIRVVPELSAPAHAGAGWNFGEQYGKGKLVLCNDPEDVWFEKCKEPPCGHLNPTNPEVFNVLENVYSDILEAFNPEFVHMGGDDTSFKCWSNAPEITETFPNGEVTSRQLFQLWNGFQNQAYAKLKESERQTGMSKPVTPMLYSSSFVRNYINEDGGYVVQLTDEANHTTIEEYINRGYNVIFSNSDVWTFEGTASSWVSQQNGFILRSEDHRPSWKDVYMNSPLDMPNMPKLREECHQGQYQTECSANQVLGGEALVWSYETDAQSLQSIVWPRGAALAERLWRDVKPTYHQADQAENRMAIHRERMVNRGTHAEVFQPEYCRQNQNSCYTQEFYEFNQRVGAQNYGE